MIYIKQVLKTFSDMHNDLNSIYDEFCEFMISDELDLTITQREELEELVDKIYKFKQDLLK